MEDKGKAEVKKEGDKAGPSTGPGGKKDYSTAILERKKSPNRLVVDDAVRAAPPRPRGARRGPEAPPRARPRSGGSRAPARRGRGGPGPPFRGSAAVRRPPRPPPGPGPAPGGRTGGQSSL